MPDPQTSMPTGSRPQEDPWRGIEWDAAAPEPEDRPDPSPQAAFDGASHATQRLPDLLDWGALPEPSRGEEGTAPWNRKTVPMEIRMEELAWPFGSEPEPPEEAAVPEELPEAVQGMIEDAFSRLEEAIDAGQPAVDPVPSEAALSDPLPLASPARVPGPRPVARILPLLAGGLVLLAGGVLLDRFVLLKALATPPAPPRETVPVPLASIHARATGGDREAMRMLALCFAEGLGVPRNPDEADFWRRMAERPGAAPATAAQPLP